MSSQKSTIPTCHKHLPYTHNILGILKYHKEILLKERISEVTSDTIAIQVDSIIIVKVNVTPFKFSERLIGDRMLPGTLQGTSIF
jgi:hypothetical protein